MVTGTLVVCARGATEPGVANYFCDYFSMGLDETRLGLVGTRELTLSDETLLRTDDRISPKTLKILSNAELIEMRTRNERTTGTLFAR